MTGLPLMRWSCVIGVVRSDRSVQQTNALDGGGLWPGDEHARKGSWPCRSDGSRRHDPTQAAGVGPWRQAGDLDLTGVPGFRGMDADGVRDLRRGRRGSDARHRGRVYPQAGALCSGIPEPRAVRGAAGLAPCQSGRLKPVRLQGATPSHAPRRSLFGCPYGAVPLPPWLISMRHFEPIRRVAGLPEPSPRHRVG